MILINKYELLTEMAKVLDERDHLREENDVLEYKLKNFKIADNGEIPAQMLKVYDYGEQALYEKCFHPDWYDIGVNKNEEGAYYPSSNMNEWIEGILRSGGVPKNFSLAEVFAICMPRLQKEYDERWERELAAYKEAEEEASGGDEE